MVSFNSQCQERRLTVLVEGVRVVPSMVVIVGSLDGAEVGLLELLELLLLEEGGTMLNVLVRG